MIVYQRYGCVCASVFIFHIHIILQYVYKINIYIHIYFKYFALSIPHLKEWAFRAFIVIYVNQEQVPYQTMQIKDESFEGLKLVEVAPKCMGPAK